LPSGAVAGHQIISFPIPLLGSLAHIRTYWRKFLSIGRFEMDDTERDFCAETVAAVEWKKSVRYRRNCAIAPPVIVAGVNEKREE
jgi:hypothetical protein